MSPAPWRRGAPWLVPAVVLVEAVLAGGGLVTLGDAVLAVAGIEALFAVGRMVVAVRSYRAGRAAGYDGWAAAEDALAQLVPRRLARLLLIEPRLLDCLARWVTGRHDAGAADSLGYPRGLQPAYMRSGAAMPSRLSP